MADTREAVTRLEAALECIADVQQARLQDLAARIDGVILQLRQALEE